VAMIPTPGAMFPGGGGVGLVPRLTIDQFFDRKHVTDALTRGEHRALSRASLHVRRTAAKSIKKKGLARPRLKVMTQNPGVPLTQLLARDGLRDIDRERIRERIFEVTRRPGSPPGTPPHTHVPHGMMLGFRRNLYNAYDGRTHSAVVGPTAKGPRPQLPSFHELGGTTRLVLLASKPILVPMGKSKKLRLTKMVTKWEDADATYNEAYWRPTGETKSVIYPPRPFMRPALEKSRAFIAREFRDMLGR